MQKYKKMAIQLPRHPNKMAAPTEITAIHNIDLQIKNTGKLTGFTVIGFILLSIDHARPVRWIVLVCGTCDEIRMRRIF